MVPSGKCLLSSVLIAFWAIFPDYQTSAADEVEKMLVVETPAQKSAETNNVSKTPILPVVQPAEPVKTVAPIVGPTPVTLPVGPAVQPPQAVVASNVVLAPVPVAVASDPAIVSLRSELMLREQELAKSNKEVERLKDIVRKIHEASQRESLVFHYNMAAIYRSNMMYKKAEEAYLKALEIDPRDAGVHYNLAILYDDNFKDKKKAKYHYEKFLELAPEDADAPKVREWLTSIL